MKIAIIDDDPTYLRILCDVLYDYKPDIFDSADKFKQIDVSIYDVILIDHSIDGVHWKDIYKAIRGQTLANFSVLATFDELHYINDGTPLVPPEIKDDSRIRNLFRKYDYDGIIEWVGWEKLKMDSLELF